VITDIADIWLWCSGITAVMILIIINLSGDLGDFTPAECVLLVALAPLVWAILAVYVIFTPHKLDQD
jgi:hypothetical protein